MMFRSRQILSFFAFALLLILPTPLRAQESITHASVTGRVLDPSGAVVSHSTVTAAELATNQTSTTETDDRGRFRFPYLSVGTYRITTQAVGFAETTRQVQLTVGAAFDLTLRVSMSQATANVQVTAEPPVIETDRSQIGETVSQTEAANLPFEGRNYLDLALLLPGVSPTNTASTQTLAETSEVVGQGYSVNSQRNFSNSFVVDGLSDNDDGNRGTVVRGSYGLYYDRIQLRPLANALLSAHNTIDPNQVHC